MEKVQNLKHCPWVSDEININEFQSQHMQTIRSILNVHPSKVGWQESCQTFFTANVPENLDEEPVGDPDRLAAIKNLYDPDQMEQECSIDLLTVPNELPPNDCLDDAISIAARMPTNWFEGSFNDSVIPEGGSDRLLTLYNQQKELNKRTAVGDYATLRYRTLKYFTTVRLPQEINTAPLLTDFPDDVIFNVRIQRPYFKKTHFKKQSNKFPAHAQEFLLLGSQHLPALRDAIECVNDYAVHQDMALNPDLDLVSNYTRAKDEFPSGMFYINGTFFVDMRRSDSKDYSISLHNWARKLHEIGELRTEDMEGARFSDLTLRLGYPYLYLHEGYCEHLVTFTDVRLLEATDHVGGYPITRGHATKLSVRCITCNRNLATWIVVDCSLFNVPNAHVCHACLKLFCYDNKNLPLEEFKLYPFFDEAKVHLEMRREAAAAAAEKEVDVASGSGVAGVVKEKLVERIFKTSAIRADQEEDDQDEEIAGLLNVEDMFD